MKLDILGIFIHPDDAELCCAGTLMKHISLGKKVGMVDLTSGQLGSRGKSIPNYGIIRKREFGYGRWLFSE